MKKFAYVDLDTVFNVIEAENEQSIYQMFPQIIASRYIECDNEDVTNGWRYDGRDFIAPDDPFYVLNIETFGNITPGGSVTVKLEGQNIQDDTTVPYTISGVEASDLSLESLQGEFTVSEGTSTLVLTVNPEFVPSEDGNTVTLQLDDAYPSAQFTISSF